MIKSLSVTIYTWKGIRSLLFRLVNCIDCFLSSWSVVSVGTCGCISYSVTGLSRLMLSDLGRGNYIFKRFYFSMLSIRSRSFYLRSSSFIYSNSPTGMNSTLCPSSIAYRKYLLDELVRCWLKRVSGFYVEVPPYIPITLSSLSNTTPL